jgi:D-serine deaminase-like pyridoxal phosphate-dependent protein
MNIRDFFDVEPLAGGELETPAPLVDIDIVERNLRRWQARCDSLGIDNRPHIKTHKLVGLAKFQLALGAKGICVQKLGEAEVMADAGISDMLVTFNIVGSPKLRRLAALARRTEISVVADNAQVVAGLGEAGQMAERELAVLVECDTGAGRNGVQSPDAALDLARLLETTPGVSYGGLMTYARPGTRASAESFLKKARDLAQHVGLETKVISTGGSPEMWLDEGLGIVTEYRAGTYAYFDRSLIELGACTLEDCALSVAATVVSVPTSDRAILDAGSKALTSDLLGLTGYGVVPSLGNAVIYAVNEEHGYLDISGLETKPVVGDVVRILPNHACPVSNLFDRVVLVSGDRTLGEVPVDARGRVW